MDSENVDQIACDCLVIGGGPAGSVSSSIVAEAGYDVVMIERDAPRPHVGESLMPATNEVIQRLQVKDRIAELNFLRKVGVQFVNAAGKASKPFFFRKHDDSDESETWHVDRGTNWITVFSITLLKRVSVLWKRCGFYKWTHSTRASTR